MGGRVCGTGQGACCAGSNAGCPSEAPICSEYGYCQCSTYVQGGPECGPGFGDQFDPWPQHQQGGGGGGGCGNGGCGGGGGGGNNFGASASVGVSASANVDPWPSNNGGGGS